MVSSCFYYSPCRNPPGTGKNEPIGDTQRSPPANSSNSLLPAPPSADSRVLTPATSYTPMPAPASASAPSSVPVPAKYTDANFHQFMKVFIDTQRCSKTHKEPWKSPFKACFPNLYYGKSHMDYYQFCQQCEDHYETAGTTGPNRVLFTASFLRALINFRWY